MQQRPSKIALLQAVAQFLVSEVYPRIDDKRLNFRVLIAANLANVVATEIESDRAVSEDEIGRLRALMPEVAGTSADRLSDPDRQELLGRLNQELVLRIRGNRLGDREKLVWAHVKETLKQTLTIVNPRFDTSAEIE